MDLFEITINKTNWIKWNFFQNIPKKSLYKMAFQNKPKKHWMKRTFFQNIPKKSLDKIDLSPK